MKPRSSSSTSSTRPDSARTAAPLRSSRSSTGFFTVIIEVVHSHGGWVNKFIGDAALCIFGVPTRTTDHASQALDAGKLISQRLAALPRAVDCGIGISTGVVTAGNLGTRPAMNTP
jgi:adenylate cyclase